MKSIAILLGVLSASTAWAGPLDVKRAEARVQAIAAGDTDALMRDYADDAYLDWVGGPLDGRYRGKAEIRAVWQKWLMANDSKARTVTVGSVEDYANPKGATVTAEAEYAGKTTVRVWHAFVYRDGVLTSEVWQIAPGMKLETH